MDTEPIDATTYYFGASGDGVITLEPGESMTTARGAHLT